MTYLLSVNGLDFLRLPSGSLYKPVIHCVDAVARKECSQELRIIVLKKEKISFPCLQKIIAIRG